MASITIEVGTINASISSTNTKANEVLAAYAAAIGAEGTNAEKAQKILQALVQHMIQEGKRHGYNVEMANAAASAKTQIEALDWSG